MPIEILDIGDEYVDYLHDESRKEGSADTITFPKSTEEVQEVLVAACGNGWPVTVQGGRTGIAGGCVPEGGLILNLSRMNAIGKVQGNRMTVQPGARLAEIRQAIDEADGPALFFPSDLTETTASIGGMVANNASGARSFKYGAVRNWIQALTVVLPGGEAVYLERGIHKADGLTFKLGPVEGISPAVSHIRKCGAVKSAAGYFVKPDMDLLDLFIGAEGTLGVVTEITLKLLPRPERMNGLTAFFKSEGDALEFVRFLREGSSIPPVAIEFFDDHALDLLRRMKAENEAFSGLPQLAPAFRTALYFEFDCDVPDDVVDETDRAVDCWFAEGEHEIETLKNFRHAIPESVNLLIAERKKVLPELTKLGTDMAVPDERLEEVMRMYRDGLAQAGLDYVIFGHIGNNHVHVNILPRSLEEYEQGRALYLDWAKQVVEWGGSVSAEHGIGKNKTGFLKVMAGEKGLLEMQKLKARLDPVGMLNAGNLFGRSSD